jgi:serine/threonine protein kinase
MGEVYRARDAKLGRDVALKVLPEEFARDPERMKRFQREAQVLAGLNHPQIAAIYGIEESSGVPALVMELVEGPTLADRIKSGPLPLDEALVLAVQIAEAIEYAHDRSVTYRDLKPANIKVTKDGKLKVLDFGLATVIDKVGNTDLCLIKSRRIAKPEKETSCRSHLLGHGGTFDVPVNRLIVGHPEIESQESLGFYSMADF